VTMVANEVVAAWIDPLPAGPKATY